MDDLPSIGFGELPPINIVPCSNTATPAISTPTYRQTGGSIDNEISRKNTPSVPKDIQPKKKTPKEGKKRGRKSIYVTEEEKRLRKLMNRKSSDVHEYCHQGFLFFVLIQIGYEFVFQKVSSLMDRITNRKLVIDKILFKGEVVFDYKTMEREVERHLKQSKGVTNFQRSLKNYMNIAVDNHMVALIEKHKQEFGFVFTPSTRKNKRLEFMVDRQQILEFKQGEQIHFSEEEISNHGFLCYKLIKRCLHDQENCLFNFEVWNIIYTDVVVNHPDWLVDNPVEEKPKENDNYIFDYTSYPNTMQQPQEPVQPTPTFTFTPDFQYPESYCDPFLRPDYEPSILNEYL